MAREIYVSTDIEADGRIPGPHSMLSLGSVAIDDTGVTVSEFTVNLETLPDAVGDEKTMAWWKTQPAAYAACRENVEAPALAMPRYATWLEALPGKPVFVGYPAAFDFLFVYWYLIRFAGRSPFGHSALDIKTLAMVALQSRYNDAAKRNMPRRWFKSGTQHSHLALDDAKEQGQLFWEIRRELFIEKT
jgi:hypothetical protein